MSAPKRTLPDSVDFKSPRKSAARDYQTGTRSYIKVSKNQNAYGNKLNIKIDMPREEAETLVNKINNDLTMSGECGYWTAKTAEESSDNTAHEGMMYLTVYTKKLLDDARTTFEKYTKLSMAATAGDWNITAKKVCMTLNEDCDEISIKPKDEDKMTFYNSLMHSIADAVEVLNYNDANQTLYVSDGDFNVIKWAHRQAKKVFDEIGVQIDDKTGYCNGTTHSTPYQCSIPVCFPLTESRKTKENLKKQRLSTTDILHAFRGMGGTSAQMKRERVRLLCDASYLRSWSNPAWMYPPCALSDCRESGQQQYVAHEGDICDWCAQNALQDYM